MFLSPKNRARIKIWVPFALLGVFILLILDVLDSGAIFGPSVDVAGTLNSYEMFLNIVWLLLTTPIFIFAARVVTIQPTATPRAKYSRLITSGLCAGLLTWGLSWAGVLPIIVALAWALGAVVALTPESSKNTKRKA